HEVEHCRESKKASLFVISALNYGNLICFLAVGIIAFIVNNYYGISAEILISIVMAMFYLTGPLGAIMNSINPLLQGTIALRKLDALMGDMPAEKSGNIEDVASFNQIFLRNVRYKYQFQEGDNSNFEIGPINLTLKKGEITFLVGGNGSGKSTLGKIISLHY